MSEHETEHPALVTEDPNGNEMTLYFGYWGDERTEVCAIIVGDSTEPVLIYRDIMRMAVEEGWGECPYCKAGKEHPAEASH